MGPGKSPKRTFYSVHGLPESPHQLSTGLKVMFMGILGKEGWFQVQINDETFIKVKLASLFQDFSESLI